MTLHWRAHLSVEAKFDSENFQFSMQKLGIYIEEEFLSEPCIGLLSSSKLKFRDLGRDFWLGETPRKSNPSLTSGLKNPKILKLVVLVHSLYLRIREDWRDKTFTKWIQNPYLYCVQNSASYSLYSRRYDPSKLGFHPLLEFIPKQDTWGELL